MYPNVKAELARRDISYTKAAEALNMSPSSFSCKMSKKYPFTYDEAVQLKRDILKTDMPLEVLFEEATECQ